MKGGPNRESDKEGKLQLAFLELKSVTKKFGGLVAVDALSLDVEKGERRGIIGPNGSGKTTVVNLLSGLERVDGGHVYFNGDRIDNKKPYEIARKGVGRTFQITKLFRNMTVLENVMIPGIAIGIFKENDKVRERAIEVLKFTELYGLKDEYARNLSGGQQKLLEISRVLMINPTLLLMDEPFAGVNPLLAGKIVNLINKMNEEGVTFIIISHEMPFIRACCKKITVLHNGRCICNGSMDEVASSSEVIDVYLGRCK
jgi:branched-chain amino acid transport system ATP-binding protein